MYDIEILEILVHCWGMRTCMRISKELRHLVEITRKTTSAICTEEKHIRNSTIPLLGDNTAPSRVTRSTPSSSD